jgi:hypothetical protein
MKNLTQLLKWIDSNKWFWICTIFLVLALVGNNIYKKVDPEPMDPLFVTKMVWSDTSDALPQGWWEDARNKYYTTAQGPLVVPYSWWRSMLWWKSKAPQQELFCSQSVASRYGLWPDDASNPFNPDHNPVGIVKNIVQPDLVHILGQDEPEWMSITCAACHTGQLRYDGIDVRIDGGQGNWAFSAWTQDLAVSMAYTVAIPSKFDQFAKNVFKYEGKKDTPGERDALRRKIRNYYHSQPLSDALNAIFNHIYPTPEGFGRTDALGRGVNGVVSPLNWDNIREGTGMVSFPPIWYTHHYDWVQSVSSIHQPLGRNLTESWGVAVQVAIVDESKNANPSKRPAYPEAIRYKSTHNIPNLVWMENLLCILKPPTWPEGIFGKIDWDKVKRGKYLYEDAVWEGALNQIEAQMPEDPKHYMEAPNLNRTKTGYCASCHEPVKTNPKDNPWDLQFIQLPVYRMNVIATDTITAGRFAYRTVRVDQIKGDFEPGDFVPGDPNSVGIGPFLQNGTSNILKKYYLDNHISDSMQHEMEGFRPNLFRAPLGYPARPMAGYWATPPYLHNGSVPNMYELLSPVAERSARFNTGSIEYDPVKLGHQGEPCTGCLVYDTKIEGNSNSGHEFNNAPKGTPGVIGPLLSHEDRMAIIEYLKVMNDVEALIDKDYRCNCYKKLYEERSIYELKGSNKAVPYYGQDQGCDYFMKYIAPADSTRGY